LSVILNYDKKGYFIHDVSAITFGKTDIRDADVM